MICAKCGGEIHIDAECKGCGIGYNEMIDSIEHNEIKRILVKLNDSNHHGESYEIEMSLLACELMNSSLLFLVRDLGDGKAGLVCMSVDRHKFVPLFTDIGECEKYAGEDDLVSTGPFDVVLSLLDSDFDGFVINAKSGTHGGGITRKFLNQYFPEESDEN